MFKLVLLLGLAAAVRAEKSERRSLYGSGLWWGPYTGEQLREAAESKSRLAPVGERPPLPVPVAKRQLRSAIFALGCFWKAEDSFRGVHGVDSITRGYCGGHSPSFTPKDVAQGKTGHAESIKVRYNESQVTYQALLGVFWDSHVPWTRGRQGADIGTQFRSIIFAADGEHARLAKESMRDMEVNGTYNPRRKSFSTEVVVLGDGDVFYAAEKNATWHCKKREEKSDVKAEIRELRKRLLEAELKAAEEGAKAVVRNSPRVIATLDLPHSGSATLQCTVDPAFSDLSQPRPANITYAEARSVPILRKVSIARNSNYIFVLRDPVFFAAAAIQATIGEQYHAGADFRCKGAMEKLMMKPGFSLAKYAQLNPGQRSWCEGGRNLMTKALIGGSVWTPVGRIQLEAAKAVLKKAAYVFLAERIDRGMFMLNEDHEGKFRQYTHCGRLNPVQKVPSALKEVLTEENEVDIQLYEFAKQLFEDSWGDYAPMYVGSQCPPSPELCWERHHPSKKVPYTDLPKLVCDDSDIGNTTSANVDCKTLRRGNIVCSKPCIFPA